MQQPLLRRQKRSSPGWVAVTCDGGAPRPVETYLVHVLDLDGELVEGDEDLELVGQMVAAKHVVQCGDPLLLDDQRRAERPAAEIGGGGTPLLRRLASHVHAMARADDRKHKSDEQNSREADDGGEP
jgi:hypothetical protein